MGVQEDAAELILRKDSNWTGMPIPHLPPKKKRRVHGILGELGSFHPRSSRIMCYPHVDVFHPFFVILECHVRFVQGPLGSPFTSLNFVCTALAIAKI